MIKRDVPPAEFNVTESAITAPAATDPENIAGPIFVNVEDPDTVNDPVIVNDPLILALPEYGKVVSGAYDALTAFKIYDAVTAFVAHELVPINAPINEPENEPVAANTVPSYTKLGTPLNVPTLLY